MKMNKFGILAFFAIAVVGCKEKPKPVEIPPGPTEVGEVEKTTEVKKPEVEKNVP
jgi:hypothetical protein